MSQDAENMAPDARTARAEAKAATARAKALRPWYRKKRFWLLGVVAVVIIIAVAGGSSDKTKTAATQDGGASTVSNNGSHPPQKDVQVTACNSDAAGDLQALVKVTNHSSGKSDYIITVAFESPDGKTQLDTGTAIINDLESGQVANTQGGSITAAPAGHFTCKVTQVDRFAST